MKTTRKTNPRSGNRAKILCADPHRRLSETLASRLRQAPNIRAESVTNANAIIDKLVRAAENKDPFTFLILEMRLSRTSSGEVTPGCGLDVLRALSNAATFHYPLLAWPQAVIFYVQSPRYEDAVRCLGAGATDYLPKFGPSGESNIERLLESCQDLITEVQPQKQAQREWLKQHYPTLVKQFPGTFVAPVPTKVARGAAITGTRLDEDHTLIVGDSYAAVQREIMQNGVLRWEQLPVFNVIKPTKTPH